jgi:hypothetical protein
MAARNLGSLIDMVTALQEQLDRQTDQITDIRIKVSSVEHGMTNVVEHLDSFKEERIPVRIDRVERQLEELSKLKERMQIQRWQLILVLVTSLVALACAVLKGVLN